jgi:alpha/beta superfamily hydrolase
MPQPSLSWDASPADATAVALVLHGGAVQGRQLNRVWSHNVARLVPFAWSLARGVRGPLAVSRLRFGVRGWNGDERSPVADAVWALDQIRERYPRRPVAVIGHSMGGRVALHVADDPAVDLLVGLAAWVEPSDPLPRRDGLRSVFIHSDRDRITSIAGPRRIVQTLRDEGRQASLVRVAESDHAMLRRAGTWTALVTQTVAAHYADELGTSWRSCSRPVDEVVSSVLRDDEAFVDI